VAAVAAETLTELVEPPEDLVVAVKVQQMTILALTNYLHQEERTLAEAEAVELIHAPVVMKLALQAVQVS